MKLSPLLSVVFLVAGLSLGFVLGPLVNFSGTTFTSIVRETGVSQSYVAVERTVTEVRTITIVSPSEETVTLTATFTITRTFYKTVKPTDVSCVVFKTDKEVYEVSENVVLVLENNCDFVLVLPNSAPWMITDASGRVVYSPIALQVITELGPGGSVRWAWDQRDVDGRPVPAGRYFARLNTLSVGMLVDEFEIAGS